MIRARIILDGKLDFTGTFPTWWDAIASAINRAQLRRASKVQVKSA
jgi:hypothetical protein